MGVGKSSAQVAVRAPGLGETGERVLCLFLPPLLPGAPSREQVQGGVWLFSPGLCDALMAMDVMLCTASIFNLCAISVDR